MKILIITTQPDPHVEMVKKHLPEDTEILIFDPKKFPSKEEITFSWEKDELNVSTKAGNLSDVQVVWYRKPQLLTVEEMPVQNEYKEFSHSAYREGIIWLYSTLQSSFWISDYWSIKRASSKAYQMQIAGSLGFYVPDTLITSSEVKAKKFIDKHKELIVKPLNVDFIRDKNKVKVSYTTKITSQQNIDFSGLPISPSIFQQEIFGIDVRVTVIGDKVFPCIIEKTGETKNKTDWRLGIYDGTLNLYEDKSFPKSLAEKCINMVKAMGLKFGVLDFMVDNTNNNYWFLEINPNGQWGFVEIGAGLPLSKSMANLFMSMK